MTFKDVINFYIKLEYDATQVHNNNGCDDFNVSDELNIEYYD